MDEYELLARRFEAERTHLRAVAYRMLGSLAEADDAVQEAWLRLSRHSDADVSNLSGWLTTVVSRVCLDMLRTRASRREESMDAAPPQPSPVAQSGAAPTPADELVLAESVGLAVLVVLNALSPAERLAFVLHDMFAMPFEEIAPIVGKSPAAARQLASRARRRVRGEAPPAADVAEQKRVVDAFLSALRAGDFEGLIAVLDPEFVMRADAVAARANAPTEVRGAANWARGAVQYGQMARVAQPALVDGAVGLVVAPRGKLARVLTFAFVDGKVSAIEVIADPARLEQLSIHILTTDDVAGNPSQAQ